jgi:hypothetical protein
MDLILLLTAPKKHRDATLVACIKSHIDNMPDLDINEVVTVGPGGDFEADLSTPRLINRAMWSVVNDPDISEHFVLSSDNTFLTGRHDAKSITCLQKSDYLRRKGLWTDAMAATIGYLSMDNRPTYDYETNRPVVMDKAFLTAAMSQMIGGAYMLRTMYFNTYYSDPSRVPSNVVDRWLYGMEVKDTVSCFAETCFYHPEFMEWIKKTYGILPPRAVRKKGYGK